MKIRRLCAAILFCLLFLAGCGQENKPIGAETSSEAETPAVEKQELSAADWKTKGFAVAGKIREEQSLWAAEYIKWQHDAVSYDGAVDSIFNTVEELGTCGDKIYRLHSFYVQDGEETRRRYLLERYDSSAMRTTVTELLPEELGVDDGVIAGMDVLDEDNYALRIRVVKQAQAGGTVTFEPVNDYIISTDLSENTTKTDLLPAIREGGFQERLYGECFRDSEGNSYIRAAYSSSPARYLYVFDPDGGLLLEHSVDESARIEKPFRTPQGELIFPLYDRKDASTRLVWLDPESKKLHVLATLEKESIAQVYGMQGTELYYASYDLGIVKWDIMSGERTLIFPFDEDAFSGAHETMLVFREGLPPILRTYRTVDGESEDWLVSLSGQKPEEPDAARVVSLSGNSDSVKNSVAAASRQNPGLSFSYEACAEQDKDDFRTRILADMTAGGGPDILYVSLADMKRMQKNGMLADLSELLPAGLLDQILPGVIEMGTVDGVLFGLAPDMNIQTVVTLKSIWAQDTWSLDDIMGLLDTGDFTGVICQGSTPFAPQALLNMLTTFGLQEGSLIDPATRESHFDSDLFPRILQIARDYGSSDPLRETTWLGAGGSLGDFLGVGMERFNALYEQYGEEFYPVGMPTKGSCGNYLTSDGVLVVNRTAANPEAVSAYMECLLSDEIQYPTFRRDGKESVRKLSPEEIVRLDTESGTSAFWRGIPLKIKEDGTTPLNDYKDFLESCVPGPAEYDDIISMVWEEAQSYFAGDKSAEEVARIVDNRIQLYLDEDSSRFDYGP